MSMEPVTAGRLASWTGGRLVGGAASEAVGHISTDSRTAGPGDFFLPLCGPRFDAHDFIGQALSKGVSGFAFRKGHTAGERKFSRNPAIVRLEVPDTNEALLAIAREYRGQFNIPVAAVTGSSGKTTTKDLAAWALNGLYPTLASRGNFNNLVGLPLSLLDLNRGHRAAVLEMGMNRPGEIARLVSVARPGHVMITNTGSAHVGLLGSRAAIAAAKSEILAPAARGTALLPAGDRFYSFFRLFPAARRVTFGLVPTADYFPLRVEMTDRGTGFFLRRPGKKPLLRIESPLTGRFNLRNLVAAAALAETMGVPGRVLAARMPLFPAPPHRFQLRRGLGARLIDDTYNANPDSFRVSLEEFFRLAGTDRKIIVCGSMGELGNYSVSAHLSLGRHVGRAGAGYLVFLGPEKGHLRRGAKLAGFEARKIICPEDNEAALAWLKREIRPADWVFLKGSLFMDLGRIADALAD